MYCFLILFFVCLYVPLCDSLDNDQFEEFAEGEGFEDSEQLPNSVEGKCP